MLCGVLSSSSPFLYPNFYNMCLQLLSQTTVVCKYLGESWLGSVCNVKLQWMQWRCDRFWSVLDQGNCTCIRFVRFLFIKYWKWKNRSGKMASIKIKMKNYRLTFNVYHVGIIIFLVYVNICAGILKGNVLHYVWNPDCVIKMS